MAQPPPEDSDYASEEDSDFAPDAAPAGEGDLSEDEESDAEPSTEGTPKPLGETTTPGTATAALLGSSEKKAKPKGAKRKRGDEEEAEDAGFENSGDEAIIEKGLKRQRRRKGKKGEEEEDDEGGEGGLVKTRSMRAQERIERKPLADTKAATVDVDALWADMIAGKTKPIAAPPEAATTSGTLSPERKRKDEMKAKAQEADGETDMIMINRTYNFAGETHTESKLVPRNSAEAKLFLAANPELPPSTANPSESTPQLRKRPKARRSVFEPPPPADMVKRTDLVFGVRRDGSGVVRVEVGKEAKKLNTVEKSAMDWAGYVDKEGIAEELDAAGKRKDAYKSRQAFLERVEGRKEMEGRKARGLPV